MSYFGNAKDWNQAITIIISFFIGIGFVLGLGAGFLIWA